MWNLSIALKKIDWIPIAAKNKWHLQDATPRLCSLSSLLVPIPSHSGHLCHSRTLQTPHGKRPWCYKTLFHFPALPCWLPGTWKPRWLFGLGRIILDQYWVMWPARTEMSGWGNFSVSVFGIHKYYFYRRLNFSCTTSAVSKQERQFLAMALDTAWCICSKYEPKPHVYKAHHQTLHYLLLLSLLQKPTGY